MKINNRTKGLSLTLALSIALVSTTTSLLSPKSAHAMLFANNTSIDQLGIPTPWVEDVVIGLCVVVFPICVMGEDSTSQLGVSQQFLLDNGYNQQQIAQIMNDQAAVTSALQSSHQTLSISENDTAQSVRSQIQSLDPLVSEEYLQFVTQNLGL